MPATLESTVAYDDSDLLKALSQMEKELADFTPELQQIAVVFTDRIDQNFLHARDQYQELADATIKNRKAMRRRGRALVAGDEDPLRVSDTLRKAATATTPGVNGTALSVGKNSLTVGIKAPEEGGLKYGRAVILGRKTPTPKIPARLAIDITEAEESKARTILERGIEAKIIRLSRGF